MDYNPALYTCWQWRREALRALLQERLENEKEGLQARVEEVALSWCRDELAFAGSIASSSPKNYQVCHHRQEVIMMCINVMESQKQRKEMSTIIDKYDETDIGNDNAGNYVSNDRNVNEEDSEGTTLYTRNANDAQIDLVVMIASSLYEDEIDFVTAMLELDSKNYHVWQHRLWAVQILLQKIVNGMIDQKTKDEVLFSRLAHEMSYTKAMIEMDFNNNSVFMHRKIVADVLIKLGNLQLVKNEDWHLKQMICRAMDPNCQEVYDESKFNLVIRRNRAAKEYFDCEDTPLKMTQGYKDGMLNEIERNPSQSAFHCMMMAIKAFTKEGYKE